jgi:hypothetical protein
MCQQVSLDVMIRSLDLAVTETLETMFFSDAQPAPDTAVPGGGICSVVRFDGDASGTLELRVSEFEANELAAGFLGLDPPDVNQTQIESVCGEMANMICGAMVSFASPQGHFALSQPEVLAPGQVPPACSLRRSYQLESDCLEVGLSCSMTPLPESAG